MKKVLVMYSKQLYSHDDLQSIGKVVGADETINIQVDEDSVMAHVQYPYFETKLINWEA